MNSLNGFCEFYWMCIFKVTPPLTEQKSQARRSLGRAALTRPLSSQLVLYLQMRELRHKGLTTFPGTPSEKMAETGANIRTKSWHPFLQLPWGPRLTPAILTEGPRAPGFPLGLHRALGV